ncbi:DUF4157 domain-containing protein [Brasilonema sennae]|nr:DUF4157 domain-containing protein [Brasilonema sennae]
MNKRSHIHKKADSSASNPVRSQLQSRPFIAQAQPQSQNPLTQTETENQEFQQQKFEATKLEIQAKYGAITPEGQERLTVLQAKMSGLLQRRLEHASSKGRNLANIPISRPDAPSKLAVQTKLTIGEPGDKYEQEADRVAAQIVKQINAPVSGQAGQNVQREEISEEEKDLQMKPMLQLQPGKSGMTAAPEVEASIQQARGGGQLLADSIREPMEQAFGADFSSVKIHTDRQSDQLNQSIQARAFTTGQNVFFRQGEYNPRSWGGQELLAHELTHVVQQNKNVVQRSKDIHVKTGVSSYEVIQRVGEEEASTYTVNKEIRRGNRRGSVDETRYESLAKVRFVRECKNKIRQVLEQDLLNQPLLDKGFAQEIENILKDETRFHAILTSLIQAGNCGEFANVIYTHIMDNTKEQPVYKARMVNPNNSYDHALVITSDKSVKRPQDLNPETTVVVDAWNNYKIQRLDQFYKGDNPYGDNINASNIEFLESSMSRGRGVPQEKVISYIQDGANHVYNQYKKEYNSILIKLQKDKPTRGIFSFPRDNRAVDDTRSAMEID